MKSFAALVLLGLVSPSFARPQPEAAKRAPAPNHARAGEVRNAFQTAWKGYYKYAFPHDTLLPLTNEWYDDRLVLHAAPIVAALQEFLTSL